MTSNPEDDPVSAPNPLDGVPTLVTTTLTAEEDKVAALKLVADSIAQQRQYASRLLIFHPVIIAVYIGILAVINQYLWKSRGELGVVLTTTAGITMAGLVAVRSYTAPYIHTAEAFNWNFATHEGEEDIIIGSRYGDEIIGATILRLERSGGTGGKRKKGFKTGGEALIRAWAVRIRYRGKGVGTELLEEAIRVSREKLGNSAKIGFAAEHANSTMVLPEFFNGGFRRKEARAAKALDKTLHSVDGSKKKR